MLPTEQLTFLEKGGPSGQPWASSQLLTSCHLSHYPNWPHPQLRTLWWLIPQLYPLPVLSTRPPGKLRNRVWATSDAQLKGPQIGFPVTCCQKSKNVFLYIKGFFSLADIIKIVILLNALICEEFKKIYLLNTNLPRLRLGLGPDKPHISWKYCKLKTDLII